MIYRCIAHAILVSATLGFAIESISLGQSTTADDQRLITPEILKTEKLSGQGVWAAPLPRNNPRANAKYMVKVWYEEQFLGDGSAYLRRAKEFSNSGRIALRKQVVATLKYISDRSFQQAKADISRLQKNNTIESFRQHWIVNGFSCVTDSKGIDALKGVPGVKKIFIQPLRRRPQNQAPKQSLPIQLPDFEQHEFDPNRYKHPWYVYSLLADRVWKDFGITGKGTLNVIHDFNFIYTDNLKPNVYRNADEIPANGIDDDKNGYVDDCYGYNFITGSALLTTAPEAEANPQLHGTMCAAIICGNGAVNSPFGFGIAPQGQWAGVIAGAEIEPAIEWAIEQNADTYSMSFSRPNLGEVRSHWRKITEHGAFCGLFFISGAGNFAKTARIPVQMRIPEDIPNVVFAAAGVQRDLSRTDFSSQGPVRWNTEHYQDGRVQKPEVCAFNHGLPQQLPDGSVRKVAINGNSFAGPMFCGAISLMLSADPDLLPWELRQIITSTASDVGPKGVDMQTGHGLINCYRAVKEVLRRKSIREGRDPTPFQGRVPGDALNIQAYQKDHEDRMIKLVVPKSSVADKAGLKTGDVVVACDGKPIKSAAQLKVLLRAVKGNDVKLTIRRDKSTLEITVFAGAPSLRRIQDSYAARVFR